MRRRFTTALVTAGALITILLACATPAHSVSTLDCEDGGGIVILDQSTTKLTCVGGFYRDLEIL